jgi:O-antigen/teichoic acid export membrane protein
MDANQLNGKHRSPHFAQGVPLIAMAMIYNQMLSFAAGILVARVIGTSQYGAVNMARNIMEVLGIVSPLGLDFACSDIWDPDVSAWFVLVT